MLKLFRSRYSEDLVLREKLKNNDEGAFLYLYRRYYKISENFILKNQGSRIKAIELHRKAVVLTYEKVVQEVLAQDCAINLYLFSLVRKLWRNEQPTKTDWIESHTYIDLPEEDIQFEPLNEFKIIIEALKKLNENQQKILIGYYYEKQSMTVLNTIYKIGSTEHAKELKYKTIRQLLEYITGLSVVSLL